MKLIEEKHFWYYPDFELRQRILDGWEQFEEDLKNFIPSETKELPQADVSIGFPALFIHAKGEITTDNMQEYGATLAENLAYARSIVLITYEDFSNAKSAAKLFRDQIPILKLSKEAMLSQTMTIGEAARMIDAWCENLRVTALQLEKDVDKEDKAKKTAMVISAQAIMLEHVNNLEEGMKPIRLQMTSADFGGALKNKRTYESMQNAVDTLVANTKISANTLANDIRNKIACFNKHSCGYGFLFNDLQQIIYKPMDDFTLTVTSRVDGFRLAEKERLESERKRIQEEEQRKADERADKIIKDEADRVEREAKQKRDEEEAMRRQEAKSMEEERRKTDEEAKLKEEETPKPAASKVADSVCVESGAEQDTTDQTETITIKLSEYNTMKEKVRWLETLLDYGVDNWVGYADAQEIFLQG